MPDYQIRLFGDPVLRQTAAPVTDIDGGVVALAADMHRTLSGCSGIGLAAPQVGIGRRLFVYDLRDGSGPQTLVNPVIEESRGEWEYEEGCLSVPDLFFPIVRPKEIHLTGYDLDGRDVSIEADELLGRLFQHELDHLDGRLLLDLLDKPARKKALRVLHDRSRAGATAPGPARP